ncbi:UvrD-helicase domain-containing protein [Amycolatopsis nalaikhensis]|uniref:AAA family ATPase n=1 Tax=Amycolatopsis nalaikhensis TaxID=715472 RepID=A0ABY8XXZ0_9PSEU|nr:UvrD-helicase domain-containing protein [Amycolatopsis sp. 2-2]WIV60607.1 AAA family ATPase [Amycolatopsis sp. 2-2]
MTTTEKCDVVLTTAQQAVVELPWDAKALVAAGAGAGKTTTLIHRLEHLIQEEDLQAADILVLSFSRAAVREVAERLDRVGAAARRVRAQTFDSWATSVLYEEDPRRQDLTGIGYDRRIAMATEAIDRGVVDESERGEPRHVVVDEVQDLVGVRRDLVEALLDRFRDAGFTVVGDVAQSIYGFQVADPVERAGETGRFFDWLRGTFLDDLVECTLDENFRARTAEARIALPVGPRLQRMRTDDEAAELLEDLFGLLAGVPSFGSLEDGFVRESLRDFDGSTGVLCQNNAQVLALSRQLDEYSVPHRVKRGVRERAAPPWVAALFEQVSTGKISESRFAAAVENFHPSVPRPPIFAWRSLRRVAGAPSNRLDLSVLHGTVAEGRLPDDLTAAPKHRLTVSTVHRAKGTEFDRVLVVEADNATRKDPDEDIQASARLLYVAMTRPRFDLYRLGAPRTRMYRKARSLPSRVERWYLSYRVGQCTGVEILDFDVAQVRPPAAGDADSAVVQRYLRDHVCKGDSVEFRKLHDLAMAGDETPEYGLFHDGVRVGDASQEFRRDLRRLIGGKNRDVWPVSIEGVRVDALETVVGGTGVGAQVGLVDSDMWLVPRLGGLGRIRWRAEGENLGGSVES